MYTVNEHLRARLLRDVEQTTLPDLIKTETNEQFLQAVHDLLPQLNKFPIIGQFFTLMRGNLLIGALRYRPLYTPGQLLWDYSGSMLQRLSAYNRDSNHAHILDIATLCLVEFTKASKPGMHYVPIGKLDLADTFPDAMGKQLRCYLTDLNRAHLVHLAACCLIEYVRGDDASHYTPLSSDTARIGTEVL